MLTDPQCDYLWQPAGQALVDRLPFFMIKPDVILDVSGTLSTPIRTFFPKANIITSATAHQDKHSVDMIVANFVLPWRENWQQQMAQWRELLTKEGVLICNALGLDTLKEHMLYCHPYLQATLIDVHDLGDLLIQAGFIDPVLDVNYLQIQYQSREKLISDLQTAGMVKDLNPKQVPEMTNYQLTYQLIQAHAFNAPQPSTKNGITKIPLTTLKQQLNKV